jgi:hypothetical protein
MTIDDRLERLTERHEALALSVASLAAENRQMADENRQRDRRLGEIMEGIASLVHVAEIHEQRIDGHESRLDDLDRKN